MYLASNQPQIFIHVFGLLHAGFSFLVILQKLQSYLQVDDRILKAVAIEHSKDADAAVEFILSEVISHEAIPSISMSNGDNGPSGLAGNICILGCLISFQSFGYIWISFSFMMVGCR